jgi:4-hydroxyphenylpyruvate dioxygenase-like putative hemolysin
MRARVFLSGPSRLLALVAVACALWAAPLRAGTLDFAAFVDRQLYTAVLLQQGRFQLDADFNEEQATAIKQGQIFKIFSLSGLGSAAALRRQAGARAHD